MFLVVSDSIGLFAVLSIGKSNDGHFWTIIKLTNSVKVLHFPLFNININVKEDLCHCWFNVEHCWTLFGMSYITMLFHLPYCSRVLREVSTVISLFWSFRHFSGSFLLSSWSHLMTVSWRCHCLLRCVYSL